MTTIEKDAVRGILVVLKKKFNNLSAVESFDLAMEILTQISLLLREENK